MNFLREFIVEHDLPIEALSYSQMSQFNRCRKQWEFNYRERISPRTPHRSLSLGSLLHEGQSAYWKARALGVPDPRRRGVEAMAEKLREQFPRMEGDDRVLEVESIALEDLEEIYTRTLDEFGAEHWDPLVVDGLPLVEIRFAVPGVRGVPIQGFIDLVAEDRRTGGVFQIDWKFVSALGDSSEEMFNMQNIIYQWALQRMGVEVAGSLTFKSFNRPSGRPRTLKDGKISRAFIRCTWDNYARAVEEAGGDPEDYREEMEPKLGANVWSLESREFFSPETIREIWTREVLGTAHEILKRQSRYPRNVSKMTCSSCPYQSLCHGELRGYDTESIRSLEYITRGVPEEVEETEEAPPVSDL